MAESRQVERGDSESEIRRKGGHVDGFGRISTTDGSHWTTGGDLELRGGRAEPPPPKPVNEDRK